MLRPLAETIPAVTVACSPNGLPTASTQSPTCMLSELPSFATGNAMIYVNLDHRQVGFLIAADDFGIVLNSGRIVLQPHLHAVGFLHHVPIGDDEALGINQDPGTERVLAHRPVVSLAAEKLVEEIAKRAVLIVALAVALAMGRRFNRSIRC